MSLTQAAMSSEYIAYRFYYENSTYPTTVTRIDYFAANGKVMMSDVFELITADDIADNPTKWVSGSEGRIKEKRTYVFDSYGNPTAITLPPESAALVTLP